MVGTPTTDAPLRLEGLAMQTRQLRPEMLRYLVLDFAAGSIAVYRTPPPDHAATAKRRRAKYAAKFARCRPDDVTCQNLAHVSRQPRNFARRVWDPKFTVTGDVDWKIRDVENDDTLFYLVLPSHFKKKDGDAEVFTVLREPTEDGQQRQRVSYVSSRRLSGSDAERQLSASSTGEWDDNVGGSSGSVSFMAQDHDDNTIAASSVAAEPKKKRGWTRRSNHREREVVYMFRVLLDGNEKSIWLNAALELGRLSSERAITIPAALQVGDSARRKMISYSKSSLGSASSIKSAEHGYAKWARLADTHKNVSQFVFSLTDLDSVDEDKSERGAMHANLDSSRLVKVVPTYAYRNRRMTEKELYHEMVGASERWEDFRGQPVGDRDEKRIGSLHAEILECHGLAKLDTLTKNDAVCYFICGPYAFASDVLAGFLSPIWPRKSRRACIFPLFQAYQKLYVGIFDDDGPAYNDDFAGRVVIDVARLRPNSVYDIYLPLRMYQNIHNPAPCGVVHVRLRVEWDNERAALLSYLKLPKRTEQLGNAVTLNCADAKGFRNAILTVQGNDLPGRFSMVVLKGLKREMKLYKMVMEATMKKQMMDIVLYADPATSLCVFIAWMRAVYANSTAYVPLYLVGFIMVILLKNYWKYGVSEEFNCGFTPITILEMLKVLLYGGPNKKCIKPIKVDRMAHSSRGKVGEDADRDIMETVFQKGVGCWQIDGDHVEFPFSEAGRYPKKTLAEACVNGSKAFQDEEEEEANSEFLSNARSAFKGVTKIPLFLAASIAQPPKSPTGSKQKQKISANAPAPAIPDKVWKRVTDPRGLPEQNVTVSVKARKTVKQEIIHNKNLMHKLSMRLFDDRMFIADKVDPGAGNKIPLAGGTTVVANSLGLGQPTSEEALNYLMGQATVKDPVMALVGEYGAPAIEMLKIGLSVWRSVFNLFTWRDPFLTSLFFFGVFSLFCVCLVFPWRLFFFVTGAGAFGPQNWLLRFKKTRPHRRPASDSILMPSTQKEIKNKPKKNAIPNFQFHNHLATDAGIDLRDKKFTSVNRRAIVPNSPLISRRFYDWPPDPSVSNVDIYSE